MHCIVEPPIRRFGEGSGLVLCSGGGVAPTSLREGPINKRLVAGLLGGYAGNGPMAAYMRKTFFFAKHGCNS